jgi:hypothetical protein
MDVYAQLEQRVDRRHGTSFDRLVRRARKQVEGLSILQGRKRMARVGIEPTTPRFSEPPNDQDDLPWLQGLS